MTKHSSSDLSLLVRRTIKASAESLFDAWTQPHLLMQWWGPKNVTCTDANVNLVVGGQYCITNQLEDNSILTISGQFEFINRPEKLVYTWRINTTPKNCERVTVLFKAQSDTTEVIVLHEKISSDELVKSHKSGWHDCLEKLAISLSNLG